MDCWFPITVPRYNNYKGKDNLVYTHVYGRMQVPCGRCPACRRRKQNEWAFRIMEEAKFSRLTAFITLTYSDENVPFTDSGNMTLVPDHISSFCKNLRYDLRYKDLSISDKWQSFRFFSCGEYGDLFERPHYHLILFYNGPLDHESIERFVASRWKHGFIDYEDHVTAGRSKYCAKYSMKQVGFDYQDSVPPFARMSRRPGIGKSFLSSINTNLFRKLQQWCVHDYQGTPYPLPRYYKEFIYSKDEITEHSMVLERLKNHKVDTSIREMENYHKYEKERLLDLDYRFIKLLKKENYGFKYKPFRHSEPKRTSIIDDLITDEF